MTRALPFTELSLRRAITAARKAGLRVTGIRADGTVIVSESVDNSLYPADQLDGGNHATDRWGDIQA